MNGQRLIIGAILLILCTACLVQGSATGCSRTGGSQEAIAAAETDDVPFFRRASGDEAPIEWQEVSSSVLEQITDMPKYASLGIDAIERSKEEPYAIRCILTWRDALPVHKQLLDGLLLLYQTFPEQQSYIVSLDGPGNESVQSDWDTMEAFADEGYTFDATGEEAESYWCRFIEPSGPAEGEPADEQPGAVRMESAG